MDVMKNQWRCELIKEEVMNKILKRQQQPQTSEQLKQTLKQDLEMWVKSDQDPPGTFHSPMSCVVSKVFIKNDMNVKKGKRLLVLRAPLPPPSNPPLSLSPMPESQKRRIKKILIDQLQSTRSAATASASAATASASAATASASAATAHPEDEDTTRIPMETSAVDKMDALELHKNFKKFDIVADHSDHYFSAQAETEQLPTDWVNRIQQERRILEEHLPDTIFVRVYESRMDILRAAIIGLKGTPYHDGLFFFDVCFPSNYPHSPPLVHYRFCGVCGINPHVNKAGDVRLSYRNADSKLEKMWAPRTSNMLQLLVSIQCLIFNARPYFNGLANAKLRGDVNAERWSFLFNENTVIKSLKTMTYTMNNPPKNFENLVVGHFHKRVCIILRACRDYWNDWKTKRCLIGDENHKRSIQFVRDIASCSKSLLEAFDRIGAKKAQRYLYLTEFKASSAKAPSSVPEDIDVAAKGKRKVDGDSHDVSRKKMKIAVDGAIDSTKHQESKGKEKVDKSAHHSKITITAPINCRISKLFTNAGEEVKRGQPLFELGERSFEDLLSDAKIKKAKIAKAKIAKAKIAKLEVKKNAMTRKILLANRCSRVGIFNMEDVLVENVQDDSSPMAVGLGNEEGDVLKKYENFKKFDHVLDISDHYFSAQEFAVTQPSEEWTNKIREEWAMLEDQLPETIFVRVNESRMDLLRAVIIGREGTPYWNGLFFFDVCFPSNYPNSAPLVHYHSGGLCINPNLKKSGEVGLSLPKTSGGQEMMWVPGNSTILELLVSIQKRFLTRHPLFNEPTYAMLKSSFFGIQSSRLYNENTIVRSLRHMVYLINKPPKNFEHFVAGHFHNRARDIMVTCNKRKIPSMTFKKDLALCSKLLLAAFDKIGAKLPEELIP